MITIIGMGRNEDDLTLKGIKAIESAEKIIVKTSESPTFKFFLSRDYNVTTLDDIYKSAKDFDELNELIVEKLLLIKDQNTVYCVDGSGVDDLSVIKLKERIDIKIIEGISYDSFALSRLPNTKQLSVFASEFVNLRAFNYDTNFCLIIKELDDKYLASDVKLKLLSIIGNAGIIYIVNESSNDIKVSEIDQQAKYNNTSTLLISPLGNYNKERFNFNDLLEITYRLRDPNGCKWDRAQTHQSIRANAIEEAYELVEAIDLNDIDKMIEESGDVLLQGLFHAVIAESIGEYDINDVLSVLCNKLITRHTHIFGDTVAKNSEEALKAWEEAKAKEKGQKTYTDKILSVPDNLPALIKAYKIQKTAKKSGFDWNDIKGAVDKVYEELNEFCEANGKEKELEGGDLLFSVVNVLRFYNINPELALNKTISKFIKRFNYMEKSILSKGQCLENTSLDEMEELWIESKNEDSKY